MRGEICPFETNFFLSALSDGVFGARERGSFLKQIVEIPKGMFCPTCTPLPLSPYLEWFRLCQASLNNLCRSFKKQINKQTHCIAFAFPCQRTFLLFDLIENEKRHVRESFPFGNVVHAYTLPTLLHLAGGTYSSTKRL